MYIYVKYIFFISTDKNVKTIFKIMDFKNLQQETTKGTP